MASNKEQLCSACCPSLGEVRGLMKCSLGVTYRGCQTGRDRKDRGGNTKSNAVLERCG